MTIEDYISENALVALKNERQKHHSSRIVDELAAGIYEKIHEKIKLYNGEYIDDCKRGYIKKRGDNGFRIEFEIIPPNYIPIGHYSRIKGDIMVQIFDVKSKDIYSVWVGPNMENSWRFWNKVDEIIYEKI